MSNTTPLLERGITRPNAGSLQPVLSGANECCDDCTTCEDQRNIADADAVTSITLTRCNGDEVVIPITSVAGAAGVVAAIQAALLPYEFGVFVYSVDVGAEYSLRHQGQDSITSITVAGTPVTPTRVCNVLTRCDYVATFAGTTDQITVNGASADFNTDVIYGTTSAATAEGIIQDAVDASDIINEGTVTVTDNGDAFVVTINAVSSNDFSIIVQGDTSATVFFATNCEQIFEELD